MCKLVVTIDTFMEFEKEIKSITSPDHVEIFLRVLDKVPDYYWVIPASSSGKHHPRNDLDIGGTVRHTKSVFWLAQELLTHKMFAPFNEITKNDIRVAILVHDMVKQGEGEGTLHTVFEHPLLPRKVLRPWNDDEVVKPEIIDGWDRICNLVETHMGIWTIDREGKKILEEPVTPAQKFVHLCDYIASRKIVNIEYPL